MRARAGSGAAIRLALANVAMFGVMGVQLPYWPVWLAHRGMDPQQIGALLAVPVWARLAAPWVGSWADRGWGRPLARALGASLVAGYAAFAWADGFAALLLLSVVVGLAYAPMTPIVDGIALTAAGRIDYGRVRVWGSVSFVATSSAVGLWLQGRSPSLILTALVAASAALFAVTWVLPRPIERARGGAPDAPMEAGAAGAARAAGLAELLLRPRMLTFLAATAFLQGSHAVLYAFGTRHWQAIGLGESTIGWLWAWGVIVEVGLFTVGGHLASRFRPTGLLVAAAVGGMVRWPILASAESVAIIAAAQTLHGATFACMHLGAMSWVRDSVEREAVQRITALYVAVATGIALGLGMPLAGVLYERFAGGAYHAMAGASGLGLVFALRLYLSPPGPYLSPPGPARA